MDMSNTDIADTILAQLGGMGVLGMMLGAKQFVALESGVQFRFAAKGLRGINTCVVKLDPSDTYTVERRFRECHRALPHVRPAPLRLKGPRP